MLHRQPKKSDVEIAVLQTVELLTNADFMQMQVDVRIRLAERGDRPAQNSGERRGADIADLDESLLATAGLARDQFRALGLLQGPQRLLGRQLAGDSEFDRALGAVEQPDPQFTFEQLNLLRQRGLRNSEALGGAAEMQFLRQDHETFEMPEFHETFARLLVWGRPPPSYRLHGSLARAIPVEWDDR